MQQNFSTTKAAGTGANVGPGSPNASWNNPSYITTDDSNYAQIGFYSGGQHGDALVASNFGFNLPPGAVVDGIAVRVDGSNTGCYGSVTISPTGTTYKDIGALNQTYGGSSDLWGASEISAADVASLTFSVDTNDVSGGDGVAQVEYVEVTVYWHIELTATPTEVPTRVAHKVYSRDGNYLGELPNVTSKLAFTQDINSTGASLDISCAQDLRNVTEVDELLTEDDLPILTESDLTIFAEITDLLVTSGSSPDEAMFKNSNRIKTYIYNYWYPNGKLVFSGQVNRISFSYGNTSGYVNLRVFSDGFDLANFIARGYPFTYTNDQSQTAQNGYVTASDGGPKGGGWNTYGQSFVTGGAVTNEGAITLKLQGTADVTVSFYDGPNGNLLGSTTKSVANGSAADVQFEFPSLIDVNSADEYFFAIWLGSGQSINVYYNSTSVYANGSMYNSNYGGGSGGGSFYAMSGDLYFITASGTPTTTTTYSSKDPVTGMMSPILTDYNNRGGYIVERDFDAAGYTLTYTFKVATIYDAMRKVIDMSPRGYYAYIDLGTAEMDIKATSVTPDFTVVNGKDLEKLDLALTIEQVKNYLLFTGGDTGGGTNLYRDYKDTESSAFYGLRTTTQSDNRVTLAATADALGEAYIDENAGEAHETQITVLNQNIDITLLTPGKTIGFKNYGNFIDDLILQIVRREPNYSDGYVVITLGRLPLTVSAEVQRVTRELLDEQTANNPSNPS